MPETRRVTRRTPLAITILIEGTMLSDTTQVVAIDIEKRINHINHAQIVFDDLSGLNECKRGAAIDIELNQGRRGNVRLFSGIIVSHDISLEQGDSQLVVDCYDKVIAMDVENTTAIYEDMHTGDVIEHICQSAGVAAEILTNSSMTSFAQINQFERTDWNFIVALALSQNLSVVNRDGKIDVIAPAFRRATNGLSANKEIISFNASLGDERLNAKPKPVGVIQTQGSSEFDVGDAMRIKGVAKGFNSDTFVNAVSHSVYQGQWITSYEFGITLDEWREETEQNSLFPQDAIELQTMVSSQGHAIIVDDDTSVVTVTTAEGNRLILDDNNRTLTLEDTFDNTLVMTEHSLNISGSRDINISAGDSLLLNAGSDVILDAGMDVKLDANRNAQIDATAISLDANTSLTAKGNATANVESAGQTTVKGAIVAIN